MTDDTIQARRPRPHSHQPERGYEVRDGSNKFGVSEERLRAARGKVGNMAEDIHRELMAG